MAKVKERGIIFSGPMVRALLEGRKTQTRRIIKPQPLQVLDFGSNTLGEFINQDGKRICCPYGLSANYGLTEEEQSGDRLWVRETWQPELIHHCFEDACDCDDVFVNYPADRKGRFFSSNDIDEDWKFPTNFKKGKSVPSIHMPRWASRITLEITEVRVEKLQDISEVDALAEGIGSVDEYKQLWEDLHGPGSWDANPWVWVISFKVLEVKE